MNVIINITKAKEPKERMKNVANFILMFNVFLCNERWVESNNYHLPNSSFMDAFFMIYAKTIHSSLIRRHIHT